MRAPAACISTGSRPRQPTNDIFTSRARLRPTSILHYLYDQPQNRSPQPAPPSQGATCGMPCGRPAVILPITLEKNVVFVRCKAFRNLAWLDDGNLGLPQASTDTITEVMSLLRKDDGVSCPGVPCLVS